MKRKYLENDLEGVDASIFSGDVLYDDEDRAELKAYVERWSRVIAQHEAVAAIESRPMQDMQRIGQSDCMNDKDSLIIKLIAEQFCVNISGLSKESTFKDLGADSLDMYEISMAVENEFALAIPDEQIEKFATIGDIILFLDGNK